VEHPKGIIGIATGEIGRYRLFDIALARLKKPKDSHVLWAMGVDIPNNNNVILREVIEKDYEWAWLLGDDHVFDDDLLIKLLDRNVDIVVPLCAKRHTPFNPVIYESSGITNINGMSQREWHYLDGKTGLVELKDSNVGNAGMLIRRKVIETMHFPWFENGKFSLSTGCDLWFCEKAKTYRFKLYVDLDNTIGHITHSVIVPKCDNGKWTYVINTL